MTNTVMNRIANAGISRRNGVRSLDIMEFACLALLLAGRATVLLMSPAGLSGDAFGYVSAAEHIWANIALPELRVQTHGFPLLISPLVAISGPNIARTLLWIHTLLDMLVLLVLLRLAGQLFFGPKLRSARLLSCILIVCQPFTATMASSIYTEQSCQFLMFFGVYYLARYGSKSRRASPPVLGPLMLGLAALLRAELFILNLTITGVYVLLRLEGRKTTRDWLKNAFLTFGIFSVIPVLMVAFQYSSTGELGIVKPVYHHSGYLAWTRTWFAIEKVEHDKFHFGRGGPNWQGFDVANYPSRAFDSHEERDEVAGLLNQWHVGGYTNNIDHEFQRLATNKSQTHPLKYYMIIPIARMIHFWVNIDGAQTVLRSVPINPPLSTLFVGVVFCLKVFFLIFAALGFCSIWICPRRLAIDEFIVFFSRLASSAIVLRTLLLGVLGIFMLSGLMEVRFMVMIYPFVLLLFLVGFRYRFAVFRESALAR